MGWAAGPYEAAAGPYEAAAGPYEAAAGPCETAACDYGSSARFSMASWTTFSIERFCT